MASFVTRAAIAGTVLAGAGAAAWWWARIDAPLAARIGGAEAPPSTSAPTACARLLKCAAERAVADASERCKAPIEQLAVYAPRWKAAKDEILFDHQEWLVEAKGTIRFHGDRLEFGGAGGAYMPVAYECDFDPATRQVLDVRVRGAGKR